MHCNCGERLVEVLGEETIKTLGGEVIYFRRRTDYLLCPACRKLYSVRKLRGQDYPELLDEPLFEENRGGEEFPPEVYENGSGELRTYAIEIPEDIPEDLVKLAEAEDPVPLEDQFE